MPYTKYRRRWRISLVGMPGGATSGLRGEDLRSGSFPPDTGEATIRLREDLPCGT